MDEVKARKIYVRDEIWDAIRMQAEAKGLSISEYLSHIIMANTFNMPIVTKVKPNTNTLKQYIKQGVEALRIPEDERDKWIALWCNRCVKIYIQSKYSIAPFKCVDCDNGLDILGTINTLI